MVGAGSEDHPGGFAQSGLCAQSAGSRTNKESPGFSCCKRARRLRCEKAPVLRFGLPLAVRGERMENPRPKRKRAVASGPGEGMHEDAASSTDQIKTVRFKKGVSARVMLHQIELVPDPRGRLKLLLQAMEVHAKKMSVLNAESAFGKMLALHLCGDEEKFQDDQIQRRLKTLQEEYDFFVMEQVQQRRAHFPGNEAKTFHSMWSQEEAAPAAELGLGLGYYPSAKKQRGEGSLRD